MNIKVIIIEKQLKVFYEQCILEYKKRLRLYCKIELFLCKNELELQKLIGKSDYVVCIDAKGKTISSEEFANKIKSYQTNRVSNVSLLVNGSNFNFDEKITISNMDMDNGLAITIIFEQLYRAYKILLNEPYHK